MSFVQANLFPGQPGDNQTQAIGLCSITCPVAEVNRAQSNGLSSIGSEIELTQESVFDFVRLPNSIELNPRIEFDWV